MNDTNETEKLNWLMGQVAALATALQAALQHHPNRLDVSETIEHNAQQHIARMMVKPIPDAYLQGYQDAIKAFLLNQ